MTNPQSLAVAKVAGIFYSFLLQKSGYMNTINQKCVSEKTDKIKQNKKEK